tara:strand:+ start:1373 stop:1558 length:186 start_codon:yes stop_codon:yes gene_type:complete
MSSTPTSQHTSTKTAPNAPVKKKKYIPYKKTQISKTAASLKKLRKSKTFRDLGDAFDYFSD